MIKQIFYKLIGRYPCGEKPTYDWEKWEAGYGLDKWCSNKNCSEHKRCSHYSFRNRLIDGRRV